MTSAQRPSSSRLTPLTAGTPGSRTRGSSARRSVRAERRLFLAEGPKAVEGALARARLRGRGVRDRRRATEQYAALRRGRRRAWTLVDDRALASLSDTRHPAGRGRGLPVPRPSRVDTCSTGDPTPGRDLRRRPRPRQRRHRDPLRRRRRRRRRRAGRHTRSTPTTPRPCGPRVGSLFHLPLALEPTTRPRRSRRAGRRARRARRRRRRRGRPRSTPTTAARRPDRLAVRQRGLGAARRARRAGRPPGRGSRSTAGPRASTSRPPPRSASTRPRARSAR